MMQLTVVTVPAVSVTVGAWDVGPATTIVRVSVTVILVLSIVADMVSRYGSLRNVDTYR